MTQPLVKIRDLAYVRLRVPDLDTMEEYLTAFGLQRSERTADALYMRGTGPARHVHICEKGDRPGLAGLGLLAARASDLDALAAAPGASPVHDTAEPGGGRRVTIVDPFGVRVDLVHGVAPVETIDAPSLGLNLGGRVERKGVLKRIAKGPARVLRLGHVAVHVADPDVALAWYHEHFGMLRTDSMAVGDFTLAHFSRCDRGAEFTDHHTLVFARSFDGSTSLNHASFEVADLDDIWTGHEHLAARGYRHEWGIARHLLGSQIFDYWRDPFGLVHEHFTDGDQLDADYRGVSIESDSVQWGQAMPPSFAQPLND
jgi:catechol 2,3-dioxygenase-like lactoylglutathione lyase family enzyme